MDHAEEYRELVADIESRSAYKKKPSQGKTMMTVHEMGDLLGLKKTDRYWLLHKNFFEHKVILGKTYVDIASFEHWYANQIKYKKVNGEAPGKELIAWSYSPQDIAEELGVSTDTVYALLKRENIPVVIVDHWKRIPKEDFMKWYRGQKKYRMKSDPDWDKNVDEATLTMPQMARMLGVKRSVVYQLLGNPNYEHFFEIVTVAEKRCVTKKSFDAFLAGQDKYKLDPKHEYVEVTAEQDKALIRHRRKVLAQSNTKKRIGGLKFLTRNEAAILAKVSPSRISQWADRGYFTVLSVGQQVRIPREEFQLWLAKRKLEE